MVRFLTTALLLAGFMVPLPSNEAEPTRSPSLASIPTRHTILVATQYIGYSEKNQRQELRKLLGVDPKKVEWCAAFVNAILRDSGLKDNSNHSEHLSARSFLQWGYPVSKPKSGDLVVFTRGRDRKQGHVGFYLTSDTVNGIEYYWILGGNQGDEVSIERLKAHTALGIRRASSGVISI